MPFFGLVAPDPKGRRRGDGILIQIVNAIESPFHKSERTVKLDDQPAVVGMRVDEHGTLYRGAPPADEAGIKEHHRLIESALMRSRLVAPLTLHQDDKPFVFDTHHESLALHAALAFGGAGVSFAADGSMTPIAASQVYDDMTTYLSKVVEAGKNKLEAIDKGEDFDHTWPPATDKANEPEANEPEDVPSANIAAGAVAQQITQPVPGTPGYEAAKDRGEEPWNASVASPPAPSPEHQAESVAQGRKDASVGGRDTPENADRAQAESQDPNVGEEAMRHSQAHPTGDDSRPSGQDGEVHADEPGHPEHGQVPA